MLFVCLFFFVCDFYMNLCIYSFMWNTIFVLLIKTKQYILLVRGSQSCNRHRQPAGSARPGPVENFWPAGWPVSLTFFNFCIIFFEKLTLKVLSRATNTFYWYRWLFLAMKSIRLLFLVKIYHKIDTIFYGLPIVWTFIIKTRLNNCLAL